MLRYKFRDGNESFSLEGLIYYLLFILVQMDFHDIVENCGFCGQRRVRSLIIPMGNNTNNKNLPYFSIKIFIYIYILTVDQKWKKN